MDPLSANRSLVFIGFMAAGKSKAAQAAAEHLGLEALDADRALEGALSMPIADFFDREGEDEFRRREAEIVVDMLSRGGGAPVALGGGSVLSAPVAAALRDHIVVWLDVSADEAWGRIDGTSRPLARDRAEFDRLHAERAPLYAGLADAIVPGRREAVRAALPALSSLRGAPAGTQLLFASSSSGDYPVFIGRGVLGTVDPAVAGRGFCITDEAVGPLYADRLQTEATLTVAPGEATKRLTEAERLLGELAEAGMRRDDHLLALGGGVVGDLAGFCAAVYQRGVAVVHLPTSLVAQVDSAYGGKTGVDIAAAKNYVGAYHQPAAVVADLDALSTLPREELAAGFAEVLKTGLLAGGELWEAVRTLPVLDSAAAAAFVAPCARYKLAVVAADERDAGPRMALNLGHTVGHAIEAASGYARFRHGEAVGLGLLAALRISGAGALRDEVADVLARHGLPVSLDGTPATQEILAALERDKKRTERGVEFVLLERPGAPQVGCLVDRASVEAAVDELR
ncbi:MAG: shikimate kinase / 3-dehydroquinate synthase [Solirubrobacterales bacterium]|nr:shikimate kinase / 3-dehydroquinate synthase [Solirubrobacterales bacterium]